MATRQVWLIGGWLVALVTTAPAASAQLRCEPIPGATELMVPGRVLLLGELHGTTEAPAFVGSLSCNVLAAGLDLVVGLELSSTAQSSVDRFLESAGTPKDGERLLSDSLWQRDYQDGRTSRAMFELIECLRKLRHAGRPVSVVLFDDSGTGGGQQRERSMAANLAASVEARPRAMHVILTGNLHSRVFPGSSRNREYEPMGYLLKESLASDKLISLNVGHDEGTAWVCNPDCGAAGLRRRTSVALQ